MRKGRSTILLLLPLLLMNFRCEKEGIVRPFEQSFEIPLLISPLKKTYSVNDTIWIETGVQGKRLFDRKTNSDVLVDTGSISLGVSYYGFGIGVSAPPGGFCTVIPPSGLRYREDRSQWATLATVENVGCSQSSYRLKIGFKPNYKGTYSLLPGVESLLQTCPGKIIPYHASIAYKFAQADLNEDVFIAFAAKEDLGADQKRHFGTKLSKREMFVFRVE